MSKFIVSKDTFVKNFISPLSKFNLTEKCAQVSLDGGTLAGITHSLDRQTILDIRLKVKGDDFKPVVFRDLNRLSSVFGFIDEDNVTFEVEQNYLKYDGTGVKFKSYFLDGRFFDKKIPLKMKKVDEQDINTTFTLTPTALEKIRKTKQFAKDVTKVYFGVGQNGVNVGRHDDSKANVDTISFVATSNYEGEEFKPIPLDIAFFDLISEKKESILVEVNKKYGIFIFTIEVNDYKLKYVTTAVK